MVTYQLYSPLLIIFLGTIISWLIALYSLWYVRTYGVTRQVTTFTVFAVAVGIWTLFEMLQLAATDYKSTLIAYQFAQIGAWGTGPPILLYGLTTGPAKRWVNRWTASGLVLAVLPLFTMVFVAPEQLLFSDPHLESYGSFTVFSHGNRPIYVAYLVWNYVLILTGLGYILIQAVTNESLSRSQALTLSIAVLFPTTVSISQTTNILTVPLPGTILTPITIALALVGLGYVTFRYDTFDAKSRARSRTVERMQEGYLLVGPNDHIIDANSNAATLLEATDPLIGQSISAVLPAYDDNEPTADTASQLFETEIATDDGQRTLEVSASKLLQTGEIGGTVCVFRDISPRKQAQQKLQEQRDGLELLNEVVRHDIRNDLQMIIAWTEMLQRDGHVTEDGEEYVQKALESAQNAVDLTKTAKDLAVVMLQEDPEPTKLHLPPILREEVNDVRASFPAVTVRISGELPDVHVNANEMLDSVFRNLLKNAIQHNETDGLEVTASVETSTGTVRVSIADNGQGVPDDMKDEVFGKREKGIESEGTGIGLHLVHRLVTRYGGDVWIEDNDPTGAVFIVELPKTSENAP